MQKIYLVSIVIVQISWKNAASIDIEAKKPTRDLVAM